MSHAPTVDADYFNTFNYDADLTSHVPVEYIFRKVGDDPIVMWYVNSDGGVTEVTDASDMPYLQLVWDALAVARDTADATGKQSAVQVHRFGNARVVVAWHREDPVDAPDDPGNPPTKPFAAREIETTYLLTPPARFDGMPVVTSAYLPPDYAELHAHLVVYYSGPEIHWTPDTLAGDERLYGVGRVAYDDDAQRDVPVKLKQRLSYTEALGLFTDTLRAAMTAPTA